jgi:antitoxin component of MazEF toxin-antitoxin module
LLLQMLVRIKPIGNSRGVILPKVILQQSRLESVAEIEVEEGEIRLLAPKRAEIGQLAEAVLRADWQKIEEEVAWSNIQSAKLSPWIWLV